MDLLTNIVRLLITMVPNQREQGLKETPTTYEVGFNPNIEVPFANDE